MSHLVTIQTKVRDPNAIIAACARLKLISPTQGTAHLFGAEAKGLIVQLPGWQYPIVIDTQAGAVHFDNFQGAWGDQKQLDHFLQAYAVEKTRIEARKQGCNVTEQLLQDGSIKLQITQAA